ncbi:unnamed protein product, partial [Amoebophrya sp. A25]
AKVQLYTLSELLYLHDTISQELRHMLSLTYTATLTLSTPCLHVRADLPSPPTNIHPQARPTIPRVFWNGWNLSYLHALERRSQEDLRGALLGATWGESEKLITDAQFAMATTMSMAQKFVLYIGEATNIDEGTKLVSPFHFSLSGVAKSA